MLEAQTGVHAKAAVHGQAGRALTGLWKPDKVRLDSSRARFAAAGARLDRSWPSHHAPAAASYPSSLLCHRPVCSCVAALSSTQVTFKLFFPSPCSHKCWKLGLQAGAEALM